MLDNKQYVSDSGCQQSKAPNRVLRDTPRRLRGTEKGTMTTTERPPDRRVRRTKQRLNDALQSLIIEKGLRQVTVQDLIDRADVGRSTFYAHYETKDDLVVSWIDQLAAEMDLHMAQEQTDAGSSCRASPCFATSPSSTIYTRR